MSTWALVPALSLLGAAALEWLRKNTFASNEAFFPALVVVNSAAWAIAWWLLPAQLPLAGYYRAILCGLPAINGVGLLLALKLPAWRGWRPLEGFALAALPLTLLGGLAHFTGGLNFRLPGLAVAASIATLAMLCLRLRAGAMVEAVFCALLSLFLLQLHLPAEPHSQSFYLGPVNDVLHGKSLLVDVSCQYGVGVIYALALYFKAMPVKPFHEGFSLLCMALQWLQYLGIYWLLRRIFKNRWLAMLALAFGVAMSRVGFSNADDMIRHPSVGPLRFGLPWLLLIFVAWRGEASSLRSYFWEWALLALASFWSLETYAYCLAAYAAVVLMESWDESFPRAIAALSRRVFVIALGAALAHIGFAVFTLLRSGFWPAWPMYLEFLKVYTLEGFGSMEMGPFSPWIFVAGLSFASLMAAALAFFRMGERSVELKLVLGLTLCGIVEFSYFMGRSSPYNLLHVSLPPLIAGAYWLDRALASRVVPPGARRSAAFSGLFMAALFSMVAWPALRAQAARSLLQTNSRADLTACLASLQTIRSSSPLVDDAAGLVRACRFSQDRICLFLPDWSETETCILLDRCQRLPLSCPEQDIHSQLLRQSAMNFDPSFKPGDFLFRYRDESGGWKGPMERGSTLQVDLLEKVLKENRFVPFRRSPLGVWALRFVEKIKPAAGLEKPL